MSGQGDYGEQLHHPDIDRLAKQIAAEIREQERPFWIERDVHHLDHVFIGERRACHEADEIRRQWVDRKIDEEISAASRAADSRQKIKTHIIGGVGLAGALWLTFSVGESIQTAVASMIQYFRG